MLVVRYLLLLSQPATVVGIPSGDERKRRRSPGHHLEVIHVLETRPHDIKKRIQKFWQKPQQRKMLARDISRPMFFSYSILCLHFSIKHTCTLRKHRTTVFLLTLPLFRLSAARFWFAEYGNA
ncbi:hypothetical protein EV421DRAFT_1352588 [Armillaria borealis]|uniref:Secreted protein n=1 Tax=Armillaria borealis TaxID=47425 RepID=A0AA39J2F5_9AGAR|nr:hypothetical protein EV421DRAFT_1352588 [Armillaria borealis]